MFGPPTSIDCHEETSSVYATTLKQKLTAAFNHVRQNISQQQCRQKELYDRRVQCDPFANGDLVWLNDPVVRKGQSRKLHKPWSGPYKVCEQLSDVNYRIQHVLNHKMNVVHFDRLKKCPSNIRLPQKDVASKTPKSQNSTSIQKPLGSYLQLVDDDCDSISNIPTTPGIVQQIYPSRTQRPPDRLTY